jgi:hypothetical protein
MKRKLWTVLAMALTLVLGLEGFLVAAQAHGPEDVVTGPQRVMVLRVYFNDYPNTSRYTQMEVEGFFDELDQLWQDISYGTISIDYQVTSLFQLPQNRSAYVTDEYTADTCAEDSAGDLSCGDQFWDVLLDAIDDSPDGLDWTDLDAIMVVMAETNASQFHRGQGSGNCNLPMGPGGDIANVGCAIFSENPTETDRQVWGRWAHEIGHAFQQGGPAHPSKYNSEFELMDSNYPGQSGIFEKLTDMAYPGWLPEAKYQTFTPSCAVGPQPCTGLGGGTAILWAMEYNPADKPNIQAAQAFITNDLYYLISVRRRVNGDDLNGGFPSGIPDEGVLIERVEEGADQWVTIQGKGGDRNDLWDAGDVYSNPADGIQIFVEAKIDEDNYYVLVTYDQEASMQPDVMLMPWTSPPGNTWETTDIWIDSPVNGYNTYRYGTWNDLSGNPVPRGNGDEPAIGLVNRLYARVRNIGGAPASDVVVNFEINDPPGLGINGDFIPLGTVDQAQFPDLGTINPGEFVDVFLEWTPTYDISDEEMEGGFVNLHTCLRVILDPVTNETVLGNQDGDDEQENIFYFEVPDDAGATAYDAVVHLYNEDPFDTQYFYLQYESDLPDDWSVDINGGDLVVQLAPNEMVDVPVQILSGAVMTYPAGTVFGVDVSASRLNLLANDLDPTDQHPEFEELGGVRVETGIFQPATLDCFVRIADNGMIYIRCHLDGIDPYWNPDDFPGVLVAGVSRVVDKLRILPDRPFFGQVDENGDVAVDIDPSAVPPDADGFVVLFAGTTEVSSASSGYLPILDHQLYLPLVLKNQP